MAGHENIMQINTLNTGAADRVTQAGESGAQRQGTTAEWETN